MNLLTKAFGDTIISDEAIKIAIDISEVALDSILNDGFMKDIPVLGTLISLGKITSSIKDRQTLKKIAIFLSQLEDIPIKKRDHFIKKMDTEDKFKETVSEKILLQLERLDETAKAELIGKLFKLFLLEMITMHELVRLSNVVEKSLYNDLKNLSFYSYSGIPVSIVPQFNEESVAIQSLLALGVFTQKLTGKLHREGQEGLSINLSSIGDLLANVVRYDVTDPNFVVYMEHLRPKI